MPGQKSFLHSVKWAYTANWGERAFSALFTFILAAVLGPREFGVVSIALIYITFLQMFLDQGLVAALIQRPNLEQEHMDAVFWMDLILSFVLVGISILLSRWFGAINHAPQVALVISVLSACIPIEAMTIVQKSLLSREMDFKSLSIRTNGSVLISGVVGIGMAYTGFGVWALVGQQLTRDLSALVLLWKLSPWRPRLEFSWKHLKELMGFSISTFIAQLANFADAQIGSILLGVLFGPVAVGLYRLADKFMNSVVVMATSSIQAVSLPEFSRHQNDPVELRKSALSCIRLSSAVTLPALAGLAAVSGPLMATIGPQWAPASNVLKVLCGVGMFVMFAYFTGPLMQALSRPHELAVLEWVRTGVGIAFLVAACLLLRGSSLNWQIMGVAVARFASVALIVAPAFLYILMRLCGISFRDLAGSVAPAAIASGSLVTVVALFHGLRWLPQSRPLNVLAEEIVLGGIVGSAVLLSLDHELRGAIVSLLKKAMRRQTASKELA
jgi:O-antigen/teichoic acid export membrane protein